MTTQAEKTVEEWRRTGADLTAKLGKARDEQKAAQDARRPLVLEAYKGAGDKKAKAKLDELSAKLRGAGFAVDDLEIAVRQAGEKLEQAQSDLAAESKAARLWKFSALCERRGEAAAKVDEAAAALAQALGRYTALAREGVALTHSGGVTDTRIYQKLDGGGRVIAAIGMVLRDWFPDIAPSGLDPRRGRSLQQLETEILAPHVLADEAAARIIARAPPLDDKADKAVKAA